MFSKMEKVIGSIVVFTLLVGCNNESRPTNSTLENSSQSDPDTHSHPNLSLHKPKSLSLAIQRLEEMHGSLLGAEPFPAPIAIQYVEVVHGVGATGHSHFYSASEYEATGGEHESDGYPGERAEENEAIKYHTMEVDFRTELTDIAKWLSDVAAKSNLNEDQWNSVDAVSKRLTKIMDTIGKNASDDSFREAWKLQSNEVNSLLDELQTFVNPDSGAVK